MADSEQGSAPAAITPPVAQSVGQMLKEARSARELSLEQISTELRIEAPQLDALEQDRFDRIGVPVFVKGYIRQYGAFLGLNASDLLAQYYKQNSLKEIQIQPSKTITLRDERQITVWVVALVILAALVVAFAVWWFNGGAFPAASVTPATQTSTEPAANAAPAGAEQAAPPPAAATPAPAPAATPTPAGGTDTASLSAAPAGSASQSPPAAAAPAVTARVPAAAPGGADAALDSRAASFTAALEVTFAEDSWAEVSDARGRRLLYDTGKKGRVEKLSGEPPFAVVLGNASAVKITLDGTDFAVPTNGKPGDYSRFNVDVDGVED